jgi:sugar/nucleoside kinase (ribokinase family)
VAAVRVVCVGLATVDVVYRVGRIPGPDEKSQAEAVEVAAGGPAANAAVTAAALGADVILVSAVGAHPLGALIRSDLAGRGVALVDAAPDAPGPPPISAITVAVGTGERTIVSRNAGDTAVGVPDDLGRVLAAADAVLIDGHHPALARAAARAGRPLVVDAGSWRPVFGEIIGYATLVACAASFRHPAADADGDAGTARMLLAAGVPHVAVTHGPRPVRWWSGGRSGEVSVPPVEAADTAGAGDAFHGALAVAMATDPGVPDLLQVLRYAIAVAGVRVRHAGPRTWLADPRLAEFSTAARGRSPERS